MTSIEYRILANLPKKYKYIARDSYGDLTVSVLPLTRRIWDEGEYVDILWEYMYDDPYEDENIFGLPYKNLFTNIKCGDLEMRLIEDIKGELVVNAVETVTKNALERELLLALPSVYKYIVRDEEGDLEVCDVSYTGKQLGTWLEVDTGEHVEVDGMPYPHLFKHVSWEDEKPWLIKDLVDIYTIT